MTSKELRLKIRHRYDGCYNLTGWDDDVLALLDALDAEDVEWAVLRSKGAVEIKAPAPAPGYRWVPLDPPDDEGECDGCKVSERIDAARLALEEVRRG